jgi:hypothetical protein
MIKTYTEAVIYLAARLKKQLPDLSVKADAEAASKKLSLEQFIQACEMYLDSGAEFYPNNIQKVLELVLKPVSNQYRANHVAALLLKAITDYGADWTKGTYKTYNIGNGDEFGPTYAGILNGARNYFLSWEHAALSVFGHEGLIVVNRYGGWSRFCEIAQQSPDGVIRKQSTDLAHSLMNTKERTGAYNIPLVGPASPEVTNILNFKIKEIEK